MTCCGARLHRQVTPPRWCGIVWSTSQRCAARRLRRAQPAGQWHGQVDRAGQPGAVRGGRGDWPAQQQGDVDLGTELIERSVRARLPEAAGQRVDALVGRQHVGWGQVPASPASAPSGGSLSGSGGRPYSSSSPDGWSTGNGVCITLRSRRIMNDSMSPSYRPGTTIQTHFRVWLGAGRRRVRPAGVRHNRARWVRPGPDGRRPPAAGKGHPRWPRSVPAAPA